MFSAFLPPWIPQRSARCVQFLHQRQLRFGYALFAAGVCLCTSVSSALGAEGEADALFRRAFRLQQEQRTTEALALYQQVLRLKPQHGEAHYEIGWSYWVLQRWPAVVRHWEEAHRLRAGGPNLPRYLAQAHRHLEGKTEALSRPPLGTRAEGKGLRLELIARLHHHAGQRTFPAATQAQTQAPQPSPKVGTAGSEASAYRERFEPQIRSPKSVAIAPDGQRAYVQALEGFATLAYDAHTLELLRVIAHRFREEEAYFGAEATQHAPYLRRLKEAGVREQQFAGKPVEAVFSHEGRYLWVSLYRRNDDPTAILPSALAVIDTHSLRIVRVLHTGAIPKSMAVSQDGRLLAVAHWGENTVGLIQIDSDEPLEFRHLGAIPIGKPLRISSEEQPLNRDAHCGSCLRGVVFVPGGRHLLVGRMRGGGIAVVDLRQRKLMGVVEGMRPTPRHLILSPNGERLYLSSNVSGYVSVYALRDVLRLAVRGGGTLPPLAAVHVGAGARTIALSAEGKTLYAVVNQLARVVVLDAHELRLRTSIAADSYPVGLALTPDGTRLWVSAQGRNRRGGNSVLVYRVEENGSEGHLR